MKFQFIVPFIYNIAMILNLYKTKGPTSFNFINRVKREKGFKKVGHAGTLDPLAEGVLIVLTDEDTKKQESLMKQDKKYIAEVILGAFSESFDFEREVLYDENPKNFTNEEVTKVLNTFVGDLSLPAPIFSAKMVGGKRLYKYAHKNQEFLDIPMVNTKVYELSLLEIGSLFHEGKSYQTVKFEIFCSSGTFIRSIANSLGQKLGTRSVLSSLVRTQVGDFRVEDSLRV